MNNELEFRRGLWLQQINKEWNMRLGNYINEKDILHEEFEMALRKH